MFVALLGPVQNGNDELFFDNSHLLNSFCVQTRLTYELSRRRTVG